jgi:hypothetical protein
VTPIPVISLWQPWASLIFAPGRPKRHETRSLRPPLKYMGGIIGIHATATFPPLKNISEELHELCMDIWGCGYNHTLPQGAILGTVRLTRYFKTDEGQPANADDRICGDWSPERYAWSLEEAEILPKPIMAKGKQGWWSYAGSLHL